MKFKRLCPRLKFLDFAENPQLLGCGQRVSDYYQCKLISLTCRFNFRVIAGGHTWQWGMACSMFRFLVSRSMGSSEIERTFLPDFFTL